MNRTMKRTMSFLLLTLLVAATAWAQTGTSSIRGTVLDSQGSVIAGATVTLTNINTSAARGQTTNKMGVYSFEFISPGEYKLEVEATGFNKSTIPNLRALVGSSTEKTITMSDRKSVV